MVVIKESREGEREREQKERNGNTYRSENEKSMIVQNVKTSCIIKVNLLKSNHQ